MNFDGGNAGCLFRIAQSERKKASDLSLKIKSNRKSKLRRANFRFRSQAANSSR
jgi:hypothetical protein